MHYAAYNGRVDAIKALTEHGADIHTTTNVGYYDIFAVLLYNFAIQKGFLLLFYCCMLDS